MIKKFNLFFLTFFCTGRIKYAPGTFASLFACLLFLFLTNFFNILILFFFNILIFLYSLVAINKSYDSFDSNDPQEIVIDEVVGQMIPLLPIPIYETLYSLPIGYYCVASFLLFRLFDIWKPFPISYVDRNTQGTLGIMLDDIVAGIYSIIVLILLFFFIGG